MYHYVRPDRSDLPYFNHLRLDSFRRQLDYFAEEFRLLTRDEFMAAVETGEPVADGVVLTFDDGVKDHVEHVLPELVARGTFGLFYVSTAQYETKRLLDVHLTHLLLGRHGGQVVFEALREVVADEMLTHGDVTQFRELTYRDQVNDRYTEEVKRTLNYYLGVEHREVVLDRLAETLLTADDRSVEDFYLTQAEMRRMVEQGMILGSHTRNHLCMSKLPLADQREEIDESFKQLEAWIGEAHPKTFCYPFGGFHTFTAETEDHLSAVGCRFSFNVEARDIAAKDLIRRRQALPRYDCNMFPYGSVVRDAAAERALER